MISEKIKIVTGYIPIEGHPRSAAEYGELGERLSMVPCNKKAFYSTVNNTWLARMVRSLDYIPGVAQADNPEKNTLAYHCVNHEKTAWLAQAALEDPDTDVFVWVDYGIFRLPGVDNQAIYDFLGRVDGKHIDIPGCWNPEVVETANPCWRFCGSVLVMPRWYAEEFDMRVKRAAQNHLRTTKTVEWEVNTWARVERAHHLPIRWYKADHDASMFNNYEGSK